MARHLIVENYLMAKIFWSTVGHILYVDQGCAGINCIMIHGITYSNHASIFANKYHAKHTYKYFERSLKTDQKY